MKTPATALTLALAAGSAGAGVIYSENFDTKTLGSFTYNDYRTGGQSSFQWDNNEQQNLGNFTGGGGSAAMSESDGAPGPYDHAIISPAIDLPTGQIALSFVSNYQNYANIDFADVDISANGGGSWNNILHWNEDHGSFYSTPGVATLIDLSSYAGQSVNIRFHHYNNEEDALDWYWQVDDIQVTGTIPAPGALALLTTAGLLTTRRRR